MLKLLLVPFILIAPAFAQTGSIEGRVTNQAGEPVRKATVTITSRSGSLTDRFYTETDSAGGFAMPGIDPGRYAITAACSGYVQITGAPVTVNAGQLTGGVTLKLTAAGTISGKVVDEDGDPVLGFRVGLSPRGSGFMDGVPVRADGSFVLANIAPGIYAISARTFSSSTSGLREASEALPVYVQTFYPSAADSSRATLLSVQGGKEIRDIEIRMRKVRVYHVSGRVIDSHGAPIANARLELLPSALPPNARTASDGTFQFATVVPGSYTLYETEGRPPEAAMIGSTPISVASADVDGVVLTASPGIALEKKVVVDGGGSAPDVSVSLDWQGPRPQSLSHLAPGSYHLVIDKLPEGAYVKSIRLGDRPIKDHQLNLTSQDDGKTLELVISPARAASISGVIAGIKPAEFFGAMLTLEGPDHDREDGFADDTGAFEFKNLAPGEYRLAAWDADGTKPGDFESGALKITLAEDAHLTVSPPLIPTSH